MSALASAHRPALLIDLDNTLVDRAGAFQHWVGQFVEGLSDAEEAGEAAVDPGAERAWIIAADADGYTPRAELAAQLHARCRLGSSVTIDSLVDRLLYEHVEHIALYPELEPLLRDAAATRALVVLSNGTVEQQQRKLALLGLDELWSAVVISEAVGVKKPDPAIFRHALELVGAEPATTWMIGDHARADIAGAAGVGIRTAWVQHGRAWAEVAPELAPPTVQAATTAEVLRRILGLEDTRRERVGRQ